MNEFEKTIRAYLDSRAAADENFAAKYTPDSEDKKRDITACCNYIISEVKKTGRQGFSDDEVFGMAVHFYDENIEGPTTGIQCKVVVNHEIQLTEKEKEELRAKARKEAEDEVIRKEKERIRREQAERQRAEADKAKKAAARIEKEREKLKEENLLFDFGEE